MTSSSGGLFRTGLSGGGSCWDRAPGQRCSGDGRSLAPLVGSGLGVVLGDIAAGGEERSGAGGGPGVGGEKQHP
jgi:hypothetical protein